MRTASVRILFFAPELPASSSGVLHSTVLAEAEYLSQNGFECMFIGSDISESKAREAERFISENYNVRANVFSGYSKKYGVVSIWLSSRKTARAGRGLIRDYKPTHMHTRNIISSSIARKLAARCGVISVLHVRGIIGEEITLRHRHPGIRHQIFRRLELKEIEKSDRLAGVSYKLKQWVQNLTGRDDMIVIPSCVDISKFSFNAQSRDNIRKRYGLTEEMMVICYSGGLSRWQRVADILNLCRQISRMRANFRFLFLTQQAERFRRMIQETGLAVARCVIRSCIPEEVPQYLSAADVGIILRDDIAVNNVASPIKIGEYLGCGLPIILTKGIGDYSEMVAEAGVGVVLDESGDVAQQVVDFMETPDFGKLHDKVITFARERISWDSHLGDLKRLFSPDR